MERETLFAIVGGLILGVVLGFVAGETVQVGSNVFLVAGGLSIISLIGGFLVATSMKKKEIPENLVPFPQAVSVINLAVRRVRKGE
jgi:general stress protein CsbA